MRTFRGKRNATIEEGGSEHYHLLAADSSGALDELDLREEGSGEPVHAVDQVVTGIDDSLSGCDLSGCLDLHLA